MQYILELACITVYNGAHNDLQQLDSYDGKLILINHKLDSFEQTWILRNVSLILSMQT